MAANRSGHRQCGDGAAGRGPADARRSATGSLALALAAAPWSAIAGTPPACTVTLDVVGTGLGAVPDATGTGCGTTVTAGLRNVSFSVPSVPGFAVTDLDVSMALTHTWGGDLVARLVAPGGGTEHVLFGRVGAVTDPSCGDASDFAGTYVFSDFADPLSGGLWEAAAGTSGAIPQGSYFSTDSGGAGAVNPMPPTSIQASFAGLPAAASAGTWTLRIEDHGSGDIGAISQATLSLCLDPLPDGIFADGFETP